MYSFPKYCFELPDKVHATSLSPLFLMLFSSTSFISVSVFFLRPLFCLVTSESTFLSRFQPGYMTNAMILTSTLSIFHFFPATYHLALLMVCTFHSSLDMHNAAHTMRISDIATSAWLIDFCHKAIEPRALRSPSKNFMADIRISLRNTRGQSM